MKSRNEQLEDLLKLEVAKKGKTASYAFITIAILSYFYGFGAVRYLGIIKATALVIIVLIITRHQFYDHILQNKIITKRDWKITIVLINLNSLCFSLMLNLASIESQLTSVHYVIITALQAGLISSSLVTLSYFSNIFIPFQLALFVPQIGVITYFHMTASQNYIPLIALYLIYFAYQIKQFLIYRGDFIKRFNYQLDLEEKNLELENNKNIIMDQTLKLIHTSRLAVMGEMSIGITHEINNPMTIISGNTTLIDKVIKSQSENINSANLTQIAKYTQRISEAIKRINKIIDGLKYYANPSDNKPKEKVEIKQIVNETISFLEEHLKRTNINLSVNNIPDITVDCHPVQISQVLINIIKNAADAVEECSETNQKWIRIDFKTFAETLEILIQNGGPKIDLNIAKNIFKPFYTTKTNRKGTGLGLSISETIMREHEGELYCDFDNEYTTFILKIKISHLK